MCKSVYIVFNEISLSLDLFRFKADGLGYRPPQGVRSSKGASEIKSEIYIIDQSIYSYVWHIKLQFQEKEFYSLFQKTFFASLFS